MSSVSHRRRDNGVLTLAAALALLSAPPAVAQATYVVTTWADDIYVGTLREAIDLANADGVPSLITFDPGLAGGSVTPASPLPFLTAGETTIDGDLDDDCLPDIGIDGSGAGPDGSGLSLESNGNAVSGLAIFGFAQNGIHIGGGNNAVTCSYAGTDLARNPGLGNRFGVRIEGTPPGGNQVGPGNVIAYNGEDGVQVLEYSISGYPDFVALSPDQTTVFSTIDFIDNCDALAMVGGGTIYDIGGHPFIENVGMRLSGTVYVSQAGSYFFTLEDVDDNARLTVAGVERIDANSPGSWSASVDLTGGESIRLDYVEGCGPGSVRLLISGPGTATLSTDGNLSACPAGQPGLCGDLYQLRTPNEGNTVSQNSIYANGQTGIALNACCQVTLNDSSDADIGANTLLNYPEITGVAPAGGGLYTISGNAPPDATVELFLSDDDPSGYGEGKAFLGSTTADAGGTFSAALPLAVGATPLTATATDAAGNTSEFGPNFAFAAGADRVTVGGLAALPGATVNVPVYVLDASLTPLGLDRPAGERIQGIVLEVDFPPGSIAAASAVRDGVLLGLTALYELSPATGSSIAYIASFAEATDPIPFTLDAAEPGDHVATITLTLAADAPSGPLALTLVAADTALSNQAGTVDELTGNGWLVLGHGEIGVANNAASNLWATPLSSDSVHLTWGDPNANEIGFRIERSQDYGTWTPVGTAGPDDWEFFDSGLAPATFYAYRLVTLINEGDSQTSRPAAATTFASQSAKVCFNRLSGPRSRVRFPAVEWSGDGWGVAYGVYDGDQRGDIYFRRLNSADLAPVGPEIRLTTTDSVSNLPTLRWNGSHYGLLWYEGLRAEPESPGAGTMFALLDGDGNKLRGDVPLPVPYINAIYPLEAPLIWDGTHWGYFSNEWTTAPFSHLVYYRLTEDGDPVMAPADVTATPGVIDAEVAAAFSSTVGLYGVAWLRVVGGDVEVWFQRVEPTAGALVGAAALLGSYTGANDGISVVWNPLSPPSGAWMVVWTQYLADESDAPVMLRRVAGDGTVLGAGPARLSDDLDPDYPPYDEMPVAALGPGGELRVLVMSYDYDYDKYEIAEVRADASGGRLGSRISVTPADDVWSTWPRVASDGSRQAVVFNDGGASRTQEIAGVLIDAAGDPGAIVPLTSGHSPGDIPFAIGPGGPTTAPLGEGFVTVWTDTAPTGSAQVFGRIVGGGGETVFDGLLIGTPVRALSLVGAQGGFALAYRDESNRILFARFDAAGGPLVADAEVATDAGASAIGFDFDGEAYGLLYAKSDLFQFRRVAPNGTPLGPEVPGYAWAIGVRMHWTGGAWAVTFVRNRVVRYGYLAPEGVPASETDVSGPPFASNRAQFHTAFAEGRTAIVWTEDLGANPPAASIYFALVGVGGDIVAGPFAVFDTEFPESQPRVLWQEGSFRVFAAGGLSSIREFAVQPDGTVLGEVRRWAHAGTPGGLAWNGATSLLAWTHGEIFQSTLACVEDPSPPPCPVLYAASVDDRVRLSWDAVEDDGSAIFRYNLYRDGRQLAENYASTLQFDDGGYVVGSTHVYEVRALNGAFSESDACPTLAFSTTAGDANGDGVLDPADIFYLVNFLLADGPPPFGDADANGDGAVTVTDIFYLINFHFAGGPPPLLILGGEKRTPWTDESRTATMGPETSVTTALQARSRLVVGSAHAAPGATVRIPIDLVDREGTPLGPDRPFGERVQALSLAVACSPCDGIVSLAIEPAGPLARFDPLFEARPVRPGHGALVASFDESSAPLFGAVNAKASGDRVAYVVVQLAPSAPRGAVFSLRLDPATTMLANQAGTLKETVPNGWLELADGRISISLRGIRLMP